MKLPETRLYAILDAASCTRRGVNLLATAQAWRDAGIRLLQYRDKQGSDAEVLRNATALSKVFADSNAILILNDRVHLFSQTAFHGVHVGQTDTNIHDVRRMVGPQAIVGISTHNPEQLRGAEGKAISYAAVGPVYRTGTKLDADPVVGLEGVRAARALTEKPLVAIGGITRENAREVLAAGADSVAVISGLLLPAGTSLFDVADTARDFLRAFK